MHFHLLQPYRPSAAWSSRCPRWRARSCGSAPSRRSSSRTRSSGSRATGCPSRRNRPARVTCWWHLTSNSPTSWRRRRRNCWTTCCQTPSLVHFNTCPLPQNKQTKLKRCCSLPAIFFFKYFTPVVTLLSFPATKQQHNTDTQKNTHAHENSFYVYLCKILILNCMLIYFARNQDVYARGRILSIFICKY